MSLWSDFPSPALKLFSVFAEHFLNVTLFPLWSELFCLDLKHCVVLHGGKNVIDAQCVRGKTGHLVESAFDMVAVSKTQSYH